MDEQELQVAEVVAPEVEAPVETVVETDAQPVEAADVPPAEVAI